MENAQTVLKIFSGIWDQVQNSPSHLLVAVALFFFGMLLKASPVENRLIPWILIFCGIVVYPFMAESTLSIHQRFENPKLVLSTLGFLLGVAAIVAHTLAKMNTKFREFERRFVNAFARDEQQGTDEK